MAKTGPKKFYLKNTRNLHITDLLKNATIPEVETVLRYFILAQPFCPVCRFEFNKNMLGMQRTIPRNKRQAQRERQQEYNRELTMQVTSKQQQKLKEMAQKHADKYSSQFGLVNQLKSG